MSYPHFHHTGRLSWLRAAVLGANDGIVSTASILVGVAASHAGHDAILLAGTAGLFAGAIAMAAGEYVSVQSQADSEEADLAIERASIESDASREHAELAEIYVARGLEAQLAAEVARQLMQHNALEAHARDELGISETMRARPILAALASSSSFALGAFMPLFTAAFCPQMLLIPALFATSLVVLAALGALAARAGGANELRGALRVSLWGLIAMLVTAGVGVVYRLS